MLEGRCNVRVDVIDANELVLDEYFAFFGLWHGDIGFVLQDLCSARRLNHNTLHRLWDGRGSHGPSAQVQCLRNWNS